MSLYFLSDWLHIHLLPAVCADLVPFEILHLLFYLLRSAILGRHRHRWVGRCGSPLFGPLTVLVDLVVGVNYDFRLLHGRRASAGVGVVGGAS